MSVNKTKRIGGIITDWYIIGDCITGNLYNDDHWDDGTRITTSPIVTIDKDSKWVETINTHYTLDDNVNQLTAHLYKAKKLVSLLTDNEINDEYIIAEAIWDLFMDAPFPAWEETEEEE